MLKFFSSSNVNHDVKVFFFTIVADDFVFVLCVFTDMYVFNVE